MQVQVSDFHGRSGVNTPSVSAQETMLNCASIIDCLCGSNSNMAELCGQTSRHRYVVFTLFHAIVQCRRNFSCMRLQAKKKGGGKKKQAGSLMDPPKPASPYLEASVIMHNLLMVESYKRKVGK